MQGLIVFTAALTSACWAMPSAYQQPMNDYPPLDQEGKDPIFSYHSTGSHSNQGQLQGFPYSYHGFPYNYIGFPFHNSRMSTLSRGFKCPGDGMFYRDQRSFYSCYNNEYHVMNCAPGSMNMPQTVHKDHYKDTEKELCSVNMAGTGFINFFPYNRR